MRIIIKTISVTFLMAFSLVSVGQNTTTAGKIFKEGKDKGKTYLLGSDKSMNVVLESMKAYNSNDAKKDLSFYSEAMVKESTDFTTNWHKSMKSLNQQPIAMIPLRIKGTDKDIVFSISQEDREWNNGSKQKLYLFEMFTVNKEGKISDFAQFQNLPKTNEFGLANGGKIYLKEGTSTFTFSNRGEVETIEKMAVAMNKMDGIAFSKFFADSVDYIHSNGSRDKVTKKYWEDFFDKTASINWKINGIIPYKISDTDPESGVLVNATMKQVLKDGTILNKAQMVTFTYDLNGKISAVNNFIKDLNPVKDKMETIKAEIVALENSWDTSFNAGDIDNLMQLYADDVVRLPNNHLNITGKAEVQKSFESRINAKKREFTKSETVEVFGDENTVTEIGKFYDLDASKKVKGTGKYITIWKKINGKFLIIREEWNDDKKQ